MAGMAQHASAAAFSGFSVCQPALGATLQWLPAIGTPELDDMIHAFLPGPASIQDKRAHISMDFFEYSRQTGQNVKFYPVATASFVPVTASPANSTPYDSGYGSGFNHSPILSGQGSWTQSPAPFAPVASDARATSRSSVSKKSSTSSSRQPTVDFANHPGMRILTKDGRDVTNSASRGCKTKEQRDHAHLMRIIKACDSCRRKKIRCDPSHRKRTVSQASTSQAEQKPAKKARQAAESPPVAVVGATADSLVGTALGVDETTPSFPSFDNTYPQDVEEFWNDFITFDQEPAAAAEHAVDDFIFDHFADSRSFSPSIPSSSTSPSQVLTPITPAGSGTSPAVSDLVSSFTDEASLQDPTVPYLNPGVAHGTNYVDFNLFSPGPEVLDDDRVLEMRDLARRQRSPQTHGVTSSHILAAGDSWCSSPSDVGASVASAASAAQSPSSGGLDAAPQGLADTVDASWLDLRSVTDFAPWYYDPGPSELAEGESSTGGRPATPFDVRFADVQFDDDCGSTGQPTNHMRLTEGGVSETVAASSTQSPAAETSLPPALDQSRRRGPATAVHPSVPRASVSPSTSPLPITSASAAGAPVISVHSTAPNSVTQPGMPTSGHTPSQVATGTAFPAAGGELSGAVSGAVLATMVHCGQSCSSSPAPSQPVVDVEYASSVPPDGLQAVQQGAGVLGAVLATILISISTPPTRRILAGEDVMNALFFQLAVFGLVSLLYACALQAHLAIQVNLVNILAITSISLPSSASRLASRCLPSSTGSGILDSGLSKMQAVTRSLRDLRCAALLRARGFTSRFVSMRTLRF